MAEWVDRGGAMHFLAFGHRRQLRRRFRIDLSPLRGSSSLVDDSYHDWKVETRQLSYHRDDRAMRPIYVCQETFESP